MTPDTDPTDFTDTTDILPRDDSPSVYQEGTDYIIRASSFGHCIRRLVLDARGFGHVPYPEGIRRAMDAGLVWEDRLVAYMRRELSHDSDPDPLSGWSIYAQQKEFDLELLAGFIIRCHIDGLGKRFGDTESSVPFLDDNICTVEYKSFGPDLMAKWTNDISGLSQLPVYAVQLSVELISTGNPVLLVVADKTSDYENPDIYYHIYEEPPVSRAQLVTRLVALRKWLKSSSLPPCDEIDGGFCPFYKLHDSPPKYPETDAQMSQLILRWNQLGDDIRVLERERDSIRDALIQRFGTDSPVTTNDGKTFGIYTSDRASWDTKALTQFLLSIDADPEQFRNHTPIRSARLT